MSVLSKENIGWVDALRVLACFLVVFSHSCDGMVAHFDQNREAFLTGVFSGSMVRSCVPLFVMMTGVLLLPTSQPIGVFYRKRIGRIVVPMLFWSLLLPVLFFLYFNYVSPDTRNPQLSVVDYTPLTLVRKLYTFIFNFNFDTVPFWYLYMLIGLYLLMPVLSPWLAKASKGDLKLVLRIWGVSLVLPYVKMFAPLAGYAGNWGNMNILGVCDWNDYGTFYYFSGFVGYLILAYYLRRYPLDWSWRKMLMITVPMFLVGYAITAYGYVMTQDYFPGNYAYLEIVWYFAGINVFMMTFPVFVIVRKLDARSRPWLSRLASYTFGIYLCHFIFVFMGFDLYDVDGLPYLVRIVCTALTAFALSAVTVALMSSWRVTARFVR